MFTRTSPLSVIVYVLVVTACSGTGPSTGSGGSGGESQPFTDWSVPGLSLSRRCEAIPDDSRCWVIGDDGRSEITGAALFVRVADASIAPDELARRAEDTLFQESGAEPVAPGGGARLFVTAEEDALVHAPRIEDGHLVYFRMNGEMHPTLERVTIDLSTGAVERVTAETLHARTAAGEAVCEPWAQCGCELGCRSFVRVVLPSGERFRDETGELWFRPPNGHPLRTVIDEPCEESCPREPARSRCVVADGVCAAAP